MPLTLGVNFAAPLLVHVRRAEGALKVARYMTCNSLWIGKPEEDLSPAPSAISRACVLCIAARMVHTNYSPGFCCRYASVAWSQKGNIVAVDL